MAQRIFRINRHTIVYGISLALLMILMKWLEYRYMIIDHATDVYIGFIALIFTSLGIWLALKLSKPKTKTVIVEKEVIVHTPTPTEPGQRAAGDFTVNEKELQKSGISGRELEVLQLMAEGCSNQEIAGRLFVSLNTIKTHSSKLFEKLDVRRRTQAVDKARKMGLIP